MMNRMTFYSISLILLFEPLSTIEAWSPRFRVSPLGVGSCADPAVCVYDEGTIWVTWFDSAHLCSRYCYNDNWSDVILVDSTPATSAVVVRSSAMCNDTTGQVWVAWVDSGDYIRLSYFDDRDSLWHSSIPDDRLKGGAPGITADTLDKIWCSWTGFATLADSNYYIVTGCYDRSGWTRFDTLAKLPPYITCQTAGITTDISGNIWVCWNGGPLNIDGDLGVYAQHFDGAEWSGSESVGVCGDMAFPTISADSSGNLWVAWYYYSVGMEGQMGVRYADGDTWSEVEYPHFDANYEPFPYPDICADPEGRIWIGCLEAHCDVWDTVRVCGAYYENEDWKDLTIIDSDAWTPVIAYGADKVWLVWNSVNGGKRNIYLSYTSATGVHEQGEARNREARLEAHPNPFNPQTTIRYGLAKEGRVTLKVYNALGQEVRVLVDEFEQAGTYSVVWDRRDNRGRKVSSGTYFLRLAIRSIGSCGPVGDTHTGLGTGNYTATRKVCVVR